MRALGQAGPARLLSLANTAGRVSGFLDKIAIAFS